MKIFYQLIFIVAITLLVGCKSASTNTNDLKQLFQLMQGHYSSEKQSVADKEFFNISLKMVPIWTDKGYYLYVEQAMFDKQDKPYRVRIYKLHQKENDYISEVYTLKNEKDWIGKWKDPKAFDALSMADIDLKSGCEVVLKKQADQLFVGKTGDKTCPSELRGASYATSMVTVNATQILSWDQGFDKEGKQVWGAVKSGYIFDKLNKFNQSER
jgi:CpeT protein